MSCRLKDRVDKDGLLSKSILEQDLGQVQYCLGAPQGLYDLAMMVIHRMEYCGPKPLERMVSAYYMSVQIPGR